MDWQALALSLRLGAATLLVLMPPAILLARWLATTPSRWKPLVETLVVLPLVLPPTVLGFYLLSALGPRSPLGQAWEALTGGSLVFSFQGLVAASVLVNIPFAVQPAQRGFEAVGAELRAAAATCGLSPLATLRRVELPLAVPGLLTGAILAFAHTLGEFGVVLMVGGAIPGETKTLSLSIYDRVQSLDNGAAATMAAVLLAIAVIAVGLAYLLTRRKPDVGA
ncbi:molybdate ABC transporter permease subunit [Sandaracinobacter neustonicus]|uniref:Molybdenum transport system permease n=1 Tax=Sandaracinobacter neustonicus TaxID=1715348 RepID=A0A501XLL1_9SPHN|nr:molybdate ABC transporter permease subunit [Sandaracinobacter neustonicus]TPE61561.1 molybdate ABC transporter permease subunit [Sandaracinobacter neustonicus]